ncbi:MAG: nicotinamide-nucleotide amidohydrolase family protein [Sulfuricaulis sp.]|nr:nicotinamide-nucleotide amidohydrolase family protein [Sulfuricaulis sp.]
MELETLARAVSQELKRQGLMLVTAESCTGGWVAQIMTSVAGSSEWFERGFVAYTNLAKREMLGVKTTILSRYGAVSEQAARAMAEGALTHSHAQLAIAITGIAGPSGGTLEKPVGTVCFAWAGKKRESLTRKQVYSGDRESVRRQAVTAALQGLLEFIR